MDLGLFEPNVAPSVSCSVCGVEFREPNLWIVEQQWLASAELLSDPDEEFEAREVHYRAGKQPGVAPFTPPDSPPSAIRREAAVAREPTRFTVVADGREVRPNWGGQFEPGHVPASQPYSIVVHAACAAIATRVALQPRPDVHINSLRTLWKVLRTRFDARDYEFMAFMDMTAMEAPGPFRVVLKNRYYLRGDPPRMPFVGATDPIEVEKSAATVSDHLVIPGRGGPGGHT